MLRDLDLDLLSRHPQQRLKPLRPRDLLTVQRVGLMDPVVVRPLASPASFGGSRYEILYGERWWRIAGLLGFDKVPAVIRDGVSDAEAAAIATADADTAEDPISEATALRELLTEERMSITRLAHDLGRTRSGLSHLLRLLKLTPPVQALVKSGHLAAGVARALVTLPHSAQVPLAQEAIRLGLNARQVEQRASALRRGKSGPLAPANSAPEQSAAKSPDILHLESQLSDLLGCRAEIDGGKLAIHFHDLEILDGVLERLGLRSGDDDGWD
jgi:ParB family chromosome partitioning protein